METQALVLMILASASPRRLELLRSIGLDVRVVISNVAEDPVPGIAPADLAAHHARAKTEAVAAAFPADFVVGADTVVDRDGVALGKPRDDGDASTMLRSLAGRTHLVHTAYCIRDRARGIAVDASRTTEVRFAALDAGTIARYVATGDGRDKAGAYGIQGIGAALVDGIVGDHHTVMGFPLGDFARRLAGLGLAPAAGEAVPA